MDLQDLRFFRAVAKAGSISGAARELNYAQSNLTARVRKLESELGTMLFHRHHRGIALTDKGKMLLSYAEKILQLVDEAQRALSDQETPRGPLSIGSMETTAAVRLPKLLARFHREYPEVDITLRTGTTEQNIDAVLNYELDGAFVAGPVEHPDLACRTVVEEELVLVTAASHRRPASVKELRNRTILVFRQGCAYRDRLEEWLRHEGIVPDKTIEFGTLDGIIGCVAAGLGISLLPRSVVEKHATDHQMDLHAIPDRFGKVATVFICRKDPYMAAPLRKMIEMIHETEWRD
jgi:DNA-binding transcriptional LysR family regulator